MQSKHNKWLLHYCEGCKNYSEMQPSKWILERMEQMGVDTWIVSKLCDDCLKKRRDDAE
jgi:hypothetical protein